MAEINLLEPLESELAVQVEYDMDEQGQCLLDLYYSELCSVSF